MLADRTRWAAYRDSLARTLYPGMVVVELGSGLSTLAFEAVRMGEARVHCIETNAIIEQAKKLARWLGVEDRIAFHRAYSHDVVLEEPADILVADLRGITPLYENHIRTILDARLRFLKPDGCLIPRRDDLWVAPISSPQLWAKSVGLFGRVPRGLGLELLQETVAGQPARATTDDDSELLAAPHKWFSLSYREVKEPHAQGKCEFRFLAAAKCHGFLLWFSTELAPGIGFDNSPQRKDSIYGQLFFALPEEVPIGAGDTLTLDMRANLVGGSYFWRWDSTFHRVGSEAPMHYRQGSSLEVMPTLECLHTGADHSTPALTEEGEIALSILSRLDGNTSIKRIADDLDSARPSQTGIIERVRELAREYAILPKP